MPVKFNKSLMPSFPQRRESRVGLKNLDTGPACPTKKQIQSIRRYDTRQSGFSLIEMVVVIVVLAVGLTGITLVINETVKQSPKPLVQTRAMELAQTYLDEILAKRFDELSGQGGMPRCDSVDNAAQTCSNTMGDEEGGSRLLFDDVDDYNNLDNSPPITASGTVLNNYSSYRVQVNVTYAGAELGLANRGAKRITIMITTPLGTTLPVSAYRVNF